MRFLVDPQSKTILGWSAKCGCSHIKNLFIFLTEGTVKNTDKIHHLKNRVLPAEFMTDYTLILIVRNPYERIVSGFLDKFRTGSDLYQKWDHKTSPLTFHNFVNALVDGRFEQNNHVRHHFTPQLSEDWDDRIRRHPKLYVFDLHAINYSRLESQFGKKIPKEVLDVKWAYPYIESIKDEAVHDVPIHLLFRKKPDTSCLYTEALKETVYRFYQKDFEYLATKGLKYDVAVRPGLRIRNIEPRIYFFIYTHQKNLARAHFLRKLLADKIPRVYIVYGDPHIDTPIRIVEEDRVMILRCNDDYHSLSLKTQYFITHVFSLDRDLTGIIKCDDDIIPSLSRIQHMMDTIITTNPDYLGKNSVTPKRRQALTKQSETENILVDIPACEYACGPFYYLGRNAIITMSGPVRYNYFEDVMVGMNLQEYGITCRDYPAYINTKHYTPWENIENVGRAMKTLYVEIHGGLGNMLFQVSAGYALARKYKRNLVLLYVKNKHQYTHFRVRDVLSTVLSLFNAACKDELLLEDVVEYREPTEDCFIVRHLDPVFAERHRDYFVKGYFQNENHFKEHFPELRRLFLHNEAWMTALREKYPGTSYFLHVRRGDYVDHKVHFFDLSAYYPIAVHYILDKDPDASFHIVSDDIEWCRDRFDYIPRKVFVDDLDDFQTMYLMSMCTKGAICANSTYSWWGSYLIDNPDKIVIFPRDWIRTIKDIRIHPSFAILLP